MYQGPRMSQHRARPGKRRAEVGPLLLGTEFSRGGEMQKMRCKAERSSPTRASQDKTQRTGPFKLPCEVASHPH